MSLFEVPRKFLKGAKKDLGISYSLDVWNPAEVPPTLWTNLCSRPLESSDMSKSTNNRCLYTYMQYRYGPSDVVWRVKNCLGSLLHYVLWMMQNVKSPSKGTSEGFHPKGISEELRYAWNPVLVPQKLRDNFGTWEGQSRDFVFC